MFKWLIAFTFLLGFRAAVLRPDSAEAKLRSIEVNLLRVMEDALAFLKQARTLHEIIEDANLPQRHAAVVALTCTRCQGLMDHSDSSFSSGEETATPLPDVENESNTPCLPPTEQDSAERSPKTNEVYFSQVNNSLIDQEPPFEPLPGLGEGSIIDEGEIEEELADSAFETLITSESRNDISNVDDKLAMPGCGDISKISEISSIDLVLSNFFAANREATFPCSSYSSMASGNPKPYELIAIHYFTKHAPGYFNIDCLKNRVVHRDICISGRGSLAVLVSEKDLADLTYSWKEFIHYCSECTEIICTDVVGFYYYLVGRYEYMALAHDYISVLSPVSNFICNRYLIALGGFSYICRYIDESYKYAEPVVKYIRSPLRIILTFFWRMVKKACRTIFIFIRCIKMPSHHIYPNDQNAHEFIFDTIGKYYRELRTMIEKYLHKHKVTLSIKIRSYIRTHPGFERIVELVCHYVKAYTGFNITPLSPLELVKLRKLKARPSKIPKTRSK